MQNLPITITAAPPANPAKAPSTSTDNNAAPAAEPFGSVLARQHTNASESKTDERSNDQPTSSAADGADGADGADAAAVLGKKLAGLQTPVPDAASTLPSDILAALLPATISTLDPANAKTALAGEKTGLLKATPENEEVGLLAASIPGGISALPGDVRTIPTLAPRISRDAGATTAAKAKQVGAQGGAQQPTESQLPPSLFRVQGEAIPSAKTSIANATQKNTFSTALEASGKDMASAAKLIGAARTSAPTAQSDAASLANLAQIGTSSITSAHNAPAQAVIDTPVTHEAWGNEFNQKVTWLATQHEQSAELHLNPPDLGPLDVVLKVSGDQATAMFTSSHAAVREAVEQALPKLREMLADNGITLGNATVNDQPPREQQPKGDGSSPGKADDVTFAGAGNTQTSTAAVPVRRHQGMVDTFA